VAGRGVGVLEVGAGVGLAVCRRTCENLYLCAHDIARKADPLAGLLAACLGAAQVRPAQSPMFVQLQAIAFHAPSVLVSCHT